MTVWILHSYEEIMGHGRMPNIQETYTRVFASQIKMEEFIQNTPYLEHKYIELPVIE